MTCEMCDRPDGEVAVRFASFRAGMISISRLIDINNYLNIRDKMIKKSPEKKFLKN